MDALIASLANLRMYDLSQPWFVGMPHFPAHPPFTFSLTKKHGDLTGPDGASSAAEAFSLGGHVGTHIDSLCHFSRGGKLHGGIEIAPLQSYSDGVHALSVDTIAPILRRGVLLDIAAQQGQETLGEEFVITPEHLDRAVAEQGTSVRQGDVVLIRTGWGQFWRDPARFVTGGGPHARGPGPEEAGARWLSARQVHAAGSDTIAFECIPSAMRVHVHLLVESGIYIFEALNLEELSAAQAHEFLFFAAPLKIQGGTGSPIRPIALAEQR